MKTYNLYLLLFIAVIAINNCFGLIRIGGNVDGITDYGRIHAFVDLVKMSRTFGAPDMPWITNATTPTLDPNGWPTKDFGAILWTDSVTNMTGTYKLFYECDNKPLIGLPSTIGQIKNHVYDPINKNGTADIVVPPTNTQTMISFKNTTTGVRKFRVIRPGYDLVNTPVFTSPFLNHHAQYDTLRFMDWGRTNGNPVVSWSDRTPPTWPTMTKPTGVAWEYQILLANTLDKNIWICVPHNADDDYVTNLATLLKNTLKPRLLIYLEYSNEVWNWGFSQTHNNLQKATNEVLNNPSSNLNYDNVNNSGYFMWRYNARRSMQIVQLFRSVFGADSDRVKGVFAAQMAFPDGMLKVGLTYINDVYGSPNQYFSNTAGAPYFNLQGKDVANNLTTQMILDLLDSNVEMFRTDYNSLRYAFFSAFYGLPTLSYEGGPDTFGPYNVQAKKAAQLYDPRMETICTKYLDIWYSYFGDLFNWFQVGATNFDTQYGAWGLAEVMTNFDTPKARAIQNYITSKTNQVANITAGIPVPSFIDGRRFISGSYFSTWQNSANLTIWGNYYYDYLIRTSQAGRYYLVLNVSTMYTTARFKVEVNNVLAATIDVPNTIGVAVPQNYIVMDLPQGLTGIRVRGVNGSETIRNLVVSLDMPAPVVTSSLYRLTTQSVPFTYTVVATNYPTSFVAENLPSGLSIDSLTGTIQGTPTVSGNFSVILTTYNLGSQSSTILTLVVLPELLLKESFEYPLGQVANTAGGYGFVGSWQVADPAIYTIESSYPLTYPSIALFGNYINGGGKYLPIGRTIDVATRFSNFMEAGQFVGADNRVLWLSALFRKTFNNDENIYISLHAMTSTLWNNGPSRIAMGYFKGESAVNNIRYWSLKSGDSPAVRSSVTVPFNQTALLVMKMVFNPVNNTDAAYLYVNPNLDSEPTVADAQITGITIQFKSFYFYAGSAGNQNCADEMHMGVTFRSVIERV